jgi:hypothetical protein
VAPAQPPGHQPPAAADPLASRPKHLEERLDSIQDRLGDRRRAFRNLHRLNCLLKLMAMELRGEASVTAWARVLRENHRTHEGKPPPRRQHDGEVIP